MASPERVLSVEGVTKVYGSGERAVTALDDVSLEARAGEVVLVMGPSGSGKTTLLTIAGGLLRPPRGTVRVCDIEISGLDATRCASVARPHPTRDLADRVVWRGAGARQAES